MAIDEDLFALAVKYAYFPALCIDSVKLVRLQVYTPVYAVPVSARVEDHGSISDWVREEPWPRPLPEVERVRLNCALVCADSPYSLLGQQTDVVFGWGPKSNTIVYYDRL